MMNFKISKKISKKEQLLWNSAPGRLRCQWRCSEIRCCSSSSIDSCICQGREVGGQRLVDGPYGFGGWTLWILMDPYGPYSTEQTLGNCTEWLTFWVPFLSRSSTLLTWNWEMWDRASVEFGRVIVIYIYIAGFCEKIGVNMKLGVIDV